MAENPEACQSIEYKRGFEDGFSDYLYAGGTGEPPPVPPRRLWNLDYRTPAGQNAVQNWFAGFRRGAGAARDAGYRRIVTVPASVAMNQEHATVVPIPAADPPMPAADQEVKEPSPFEEIPSPVPVESKGRPEPLVPDKSAPLSPIKKLSPKGPATLPNSAGASLEAADAPLPKDLMPIASQISNVTRATGTDRKSVAKPASLEKTPNCDGIALMNTDKSHDPVPSVEKEATPSVPAMLSSYSGGLDPEPTNCLSRLAVPFQRTEEASPQKEEPSPGADAVSPNDGESVPPEAAPSLGIDAETKEDVEPVALSSYSDALEPGLSNGRSLIR
jgi:hypothetical protein